MVHSCQPSRAFLGSRNFTDWIPSTSTDTEKSRSPLPRRRSAPDAAKARATRGTVSRRNPSREAPARSRKTPAMKAAKEARSAARDTSVSRARRSSPQTHCARRIHQRKPARETGGRWLLTSSPPPGKGAVAFDQRQEGQRPWSAAAAGGVHAEPVADPKPVRLSLPLAPEDKIACPGDEPLELMGRAGRGEMQVRYGGRLPVNVPDGIGRQVLAGSADRRPLPAGGRGAPRRVGGGQDRFGLPRAGRCGIHQQGGFRRRVHRLLEQGEWEQGGDSAGNGRKRSPSLRAEREDAGSRAAGRYFRKTRRQAGSPECEAHRERHRGKALPCRGARHGQEALAGGEGFRGGPDLYGDSPDAPLREDPR